jgi:fluoride exporter
LVAADGLYEFCGQIGGLQIDRADLRELIAIFAGGAVGALARAGLVEGLPHAPSEWPWATFAANALGALALGYFVTRLQERLPLSAYRRPLLGTGFCGALTTFSTMQLELVRMFQHGAVTTALGYSAASLATGLIAISLASHLVRRSSFLG